MASDRLLDLIQKGITVAQVAKVSQRFNDAGIMVHAYLMYGFPTQTVQETVDSLEMIRQFFETGILKSAFWHLFTMTAHSPVGLAPDKYKVKKVSEAIAAAILLSVAAVLRSSSGLMPTVSVIVPFVKIGLQSFRIEVYKRSSPSRNGPRNG